MSNVDPNQNPFHSLPHPPQKAATPVYSSQGPPLPRRARLGFFDCFFEAKNLLGNDYWLFWALTFVGMFIAGVLPLILYGPIYCGIGLCLLAKEQGRQPSFDLMFKGFEQFVNSLIPVLLYSLLLIVILPLYLGGLVGGAVLIGSGEGTGIILGVGLIAIGVSFMMIGSAFVTYGYLFSSFLVAEYKLEGMDAFTVSLAGIQKNFFGLLGVTIATSILAIVSILLCYIPFFLIIPILVSGPFICYQKIFRPPSRPPQLQKIPLPG